MQDLFNDNDNETIKIRKADILIIYHNEKYVWGLVLRDFERRCMELGKDKIDFKAYHCLHMNKFMAIYFVVKYFNKNLKNS